jgi:hypothetical protein
LLALAGGAVSLAIADDDLAELPVIYQDDFENGADHWTPTDAAAWKVKTSDAGKTYSQHGKKSNYKPPHRSPFNISLLNDVTAGDFVYDAKVLSTHEDYGHRDACLVFGYQDAGHFYYVHFGRKTDDHANQIFIVNGADRKKISTKTTKGTPWDEKWRQVRIRRNAASGSIEVFFDDMSTPVMTAVDKTFPSGRFGLGSFDDTTDWDDVVIRGNKSPEKK